MNDINELAKALSLAQIEMNGAFKDAKNPFFKSNYADLKQVMQVFQTYYAPKGLAVAQLVSGKCLKTILMHTSGQSISSEGEIPIAKPNDPQAFGSALTYMRRYTLAAIIGCYQTDDDAELAMGRTEAPKIDSKPITAKPILTPKEPVKIVASVATKFVCIADGSKLVKVLGKDEGAGFSIETGKSEPQATRPTAKPPTRKPR